MAKKQGGGKLLPLPFTRFGELEALGLKARVYCSSCYDHRPIDANTEHLRERCFATTRFKCTKVRYTGDVCGCIGSVEIQPTVLLPIGGKDDIAFLFCVSCQPSWKINHVPIDQPPWSVAKRASGDRFKCPGCHRPVAWRIHGPTWRPSYSSDVAIVRLQGESPDLWIVDRFSGDGGLHRCALARRRWHPRAAITIQ